MAQLNVGNQGELAQDELREHAGQGLGSSTRQLPVSLTATNYIAQYAGGAALNDTAGPWTEFSPTRVPQVVLGSGGANPTVYTLTGTRITNGDSFSQQVTATGPGTYAFAEPVSTITAFSSDVDPVGTTDLQAGDTEVWPASREIVIAVAGDVVCELQDDGATATMTLPAGMLPRRVKRINITGTTATGLSLGW